MKVFKELDQNFNSVWFIHAENPSGSCCFGELALLPSQPGKLRHIGGDWRAACGGSGSRTTAGGPPVALWADRHAACFLACPYLYLNLWLGSGGGPGSSRGELPAVRRRIAWGAFGAPSVADSSSREVWPGHAEGPMWFHACPSFRIS